MWGVRQQSRKVLGAVEHAIPAKPVPDLLRAWKHYLSQIEEDLKLRSAKTGHYQHCGGRRGRCGNGICDADAIATACGICGGK